MVLYFSAFYASLVLFTFRLSTQYLRTITFYLPDRVVVIVVVSHFTGPQRM